MKSKKFYKHVKLLPSKVEIFLKIMIKIEMNFHKFFLSKNPPIINMKNTSYILMMHSSTEQTTNF